jgi:hypothetical protein
VNGLEGSFNGTLNLSFKKIEGKDNPKICAFYIAKGSLAELNITLPGHFGEDEVREYVPSGCSNAIHGTGPLADQQ